jgi:hypothetical protein
LANEQYGFYNNVAAESAVFKLIELIFSVWNIKEYIMALFCHLTKPFDCVCHALDFKVGILWSKRLYIKLI